MTAIHNISHKVQILNKISMVNRVTNQSQGQSESGTLDGWSGRRVSKSSIQVWSGVEGARSREAVWLPLSRNLLSEVSKCWVLVVCRLGYVSTSLVLSVHADTLWPYGTCLPPRPVYLPGCSLALSQRSIQVKVEKNTRPWHDSCSSKMESLLLLQNILFRGCTTQGGIPARTIRV